MGPQCMDPGLITSCNGGSIEVCIEREGGREKVWERVIETRNSLESLFISHFSFPIVQMLVISSL